MLCEVSSPPKQISKQLAARLKIMTALNTAEQRLPQDGRCHIQVNDKKVNLRISTCPTLHGEKIVLRVLDGIQQLAIDDLGFSEEQKSLFLDSIHQPQGLILVTGPTGSGKTMSLYAALKHLNHPTRNISSVEDPVEVSLPGINQVAVNTKINLDFASIAECMSVLFVFKH